MHRPKRSSSDQELPKLPSETSPHAYPIQGSAHATTCSPRGVSDSAQEKES